MTVSQQGKGKPRKDGGTPGRSNREERLTSHLNGHSDGAGGASWNVPRGAAEESNQRARVRGRRSSENQYSRLSLLLPSSLLPLVKPSWKTEQREAE